MKRLLTRACGLALCLALWGPVAKADEGSNVVGDWIAALVAAIEEIVVGEEPGEESSLQEGTPPPELGELFLPGG